MKRNTILAAIAILLLAFYYNVWLLLLLVVIPVGYFAIKYMEKREPPRVTFANTEEVELKYGEPDDLVVLDASRANELSALILFYTAQDIMVVAGEELKISDMISTSGAFFGSSTCALAKEFIPSNIIADNNNFFIFNNLFCCPWVQR